MLCIHFVIPVIKRIQLMLCIHFVVPVIKRIQTPVVVRRFALMLVHVEFCIIREFYFVLASIGLDSCFISPTFLNFEL